MALTTENGGRRAHLWLRALVEEARLHHCAQHAGPREVKIRAESVVATQREARRGSAVARVAMPQRHGNSRVFVVVQLVLLLSSMCELDAWNGLLVLPGRRASLHGNRGPVKLASRPGPVLLGSASAPTFPSRAGGSCIQMASQVSMPPPPARE